ncbi:hypothetical protein BO71DRAFT_446088 [Aspergillus ellipticus CBS 707.79]|uniref:Zn(2)-C6 fungal-type domain-containing protein n=1 Tax=Aspergillus ellipticus CBS 707.79 TaxID=1448320 RepID=A0A319DRP0_9EURO|nr:hypothetical protein BO71DRAFT_446088 [Aspergillus ellipticus CBS 707.79]
MNKRSCTLCNQKKLRCDRKYPCDRCVRGGKACVFPPSKRASRKLNRPPVADLLARINQLEAEVESLRFTADNEPGSIPSEQNRPDEQIESHEVKGRRDIPHRISGLVVEENNSQHLDVEASTVFCGLFGHYRWSANAFRIDHFQPEQIRMLWRTYQKNVAPLIPIIHKHCVELIICDISDGVDLDPSCEALVLSICFAAVVSMKPEQSFNQNYDAIIQDYTVAVDQALGRANFIESPNLLVLQAAILFLLSLRPLSDTGLLGAESAVVIRVAQDQKLHRDGRIIGLSPFQTEMRRRLWWHICILDMLIAEDRGTDIQIKPGMFDTQFPSNIDDDDLSPDMTEYPSDRTGYTDITLCIMHCEIMTSLRSLGCFAHQAPQLSITDQTNLVKSLGKRLQDQYLDHFNLEVPIQWVFAMISRLTLSEAWLTIHFHTSSANDAHEPCSPQKDNDLAFRTAVELVEYTYLLQTNEKASQWTWLCKSHKQLHVVAFVFSELCLRPINPETDRAWNVANRMYSWWEQDFPRINSMFRKTLAHLKERAASTRAINIQLLASQAILCRPPIV